MGCFQVVARSFAVLVLLGASAAADTGAKLDRWFKITRVEEVNRGIPEAIVAGSGENDGFLSGVATEDVQNVAEKHFGAKVLTEDLRKTLDGKMPETALDAEIAFFTSPLGRRIVDLEVAAADPALADLIDEEGSRIMSDLEQSNRPRAQMVADLLEAARLIEWGTAAAMNMGYAMVSALYGDKMSDEQILNLLNSVSGEMREEIAASMVSQVAWTYRDLTDDEFKKLLNHYQSAEGRAAAKAVLEAYRVVMVVRSRAFGNDLRVLMRQRKS